MPIHNYSGWERDFYNMRSVMGKGWTEDSLKEIFGLKPYLMSEPEALIETWNTIIKD